MDAEYSKSLKRGSWKINWFFCSFYVSKYSASIYHVSIVEKINSSMYVVKATWPCTDSSVREYQRYTGGHSGGQCQVVYQGHPGGQCQVVVHKRYTGGHSGGQCQVVVHKGYTGGHSGGQCQVVLHPIELSPWLIGYLQRLTGFNLGPGFSLSVRWI